MKNLFPQIVEYQPYSMCNANCQYCPVGSINRTEKTKGESISSEVLERLIDQTKGKKLKRISPHLNCEPLLCKDLPEQIRNWKSVHPNTEIDLSTNCVFLTEDKIMELSEAGLDTLEFHFMGVSKDYHENAMQTKFKKVQENVERALHLKNRKNLNMRMYIFSHRLRGASLNEWYDFANIWKSKGADFVFGPLWNRAGYYGEEFNSKKKGILKSFDPYPCNKPFNQIAVEFNGEVVICSLDYKHKVKIGNIMENSIEQIWNNEVMRRYQEGQNNKNKLKKLDLCKDCIRGGRYFLDERKLTKILNKEFTNPIYKKAYKGYLGLLDYF